MAKLAHNHYVAFADVNFTDGQDVLVLKSLKGFDFANELFWNTVFGASDFHALKCNDFV